MASDWLFGTTLELSVLIGLVLILRPISLRLFGARVSYWLWFIPLLRAVLIDRPDRPVAVLETIGLPGSDIASKLYPSPEAWPLSSAFPWLAFWLGGIGVWLTMRGIGWMRFRAALREKVAPLAIPQSVLDKLPSRLRSIEVRYYAADMSGAPFAFGLIRSAICLPVDFLHRFSAQQQEWILHHELVHLLRRDLWMQLAWELLRCVFWFNPIVHLAAATVRCDQELACDQSVLGESSARDRYCYGRTLIQCSARHLFPSALTFPGRYKERIAMLEKHRNSGARNVLGLVLCALIACFALTRAPISVAQTDLDKPLTFNFTHLEISKVVDVILEFSGLEAEGLNRIPRRAVTISGERMPARELLERVLACAGLTFVESGSSIELVPAERESDAVCAA